MLDIKSFRSNLLIVFLLLLSSVVLYSLQNYLFHSPRDTFFYLFQDLAFVPIQVIIVTLLLDKVLSAREKQEKLLKLNMVISAFFGEVGTGAIAAMSAAILNLDTLRGNLKVSSQWQEADFINASTLIKGFDFCVKCTTEQLHHIKDLLCAKKSYMLRMFDNPNLMEHDAFTEMLWALFHVLDELESRDSFTELPESDQAHLSNDITRAFRYLLLEWVCYMKYLKNDYPYLFSLASRKNPFGDGESVVFEN